MSSMGRKRTLASKVRSGWKADIGEPTDRLWEKRNGDQTRDVRDEPRNDL